METLMLPNARQAMREGIRYGTKDSSTGAIRALKESVLSDVQKSVASGSRPESTMQLMLTKKGYRAVQEALLPTEEGRQIFKSMEKNIVGDMFESLLDKEGKVDFSKAKELLKDPHLVRIVEDVGGKDAVDFLRKAEGYGDQIAKNLKAVERASERLAFAKDKTAKGLIPTGTKAKSGVIEKAMKERGSKDIEALSRKMGLPSGAREWTTREQKKVGNVFERIKAVGKDGKAIISMLTGLFSAPAGAALGLTLYGAEASHKLYWNMVTNAKTREAIKRLADPENYNSSRLPVILSQLEKSLEKEDK